MGMCDYRIVSYRRVIVSNQLQHGARPARFRRCERGPSKHPNARLKTTRQKSSECQSKSRMLASSLQVQSLVVQSLASIQPLSIVIRQLIQQTNTQNHDQQSDRDDNKQGEAEPAQDHGGGADAGDDAAVAEVLGDGAGADRGRVLPQHRHQHEHRRHEDQRQRHLRHGPRREGLDVVGGPFFVRFFVPAREGGEEDEADEGEDDGDDSVERVS